MYSMRAAFSSWSLAGSGFDGSSWAWPAAISKEQRITPHKNRIADDLRVEENPDDPFTHNKDNLSVMSTGRASKPGPILQADSGAVAEKREVSTSTCFGRCGNFRCRKRYIRH